MSDVPPPLKSPVPAGVGVARVAQADASSENTGVWPATRTYVRDTAFMSALKTFGAFVIAIAIGAVLGWERLETKAEAAGVRAAAAFEPRVTATEQLRIEVWDLRRELRAFMDSQRTGVPLVLPPLPPPPPPAGGQKDAGP